MEQKKKRPSSQLRLSGFEEWRLYLVSSEYACPWKLVASTSYVALSSVPQRKLVRKSTTKGQKSLSCIHHWNALNVAAWNAQENNWKRGSTEQGGRCFVMKRHPGDGVPLGDDVNGYCSFFSEKLSWWRRNDYLVILKSPSWVFLCRISCSSVTSSSCIKSAVMSK